MKSRTNATSWLFSFFKGDSSMWFLLMRLRILGVRGICVALAILAATAALWAQSDSRYVERLQPSLEQIMRELKLPGLAVGVVEDGRLVYSRGFGIMKLGEDRPVTPETLFHMASITKPFVATSIMQLVEQGKVDLDAPVVRYLPYFKLHDPCYASITVRQMVTHTSGMPDVQDYLWNKPEYDDGALERYVRTLVDRDLLWEPGSKFRYSNMAFEVLGDLVAKVSGVSFEDYVDAHILQPLGMKSSTLLIKKADQARLAAGHTRGKDGVVRLIEHYPYNRAHTPSSNLHSNVVDMAHWAMANINRGELSGQRILKSSAYDVMWKPAAEAEGRRSVGISWFLNDLNGQQAVFHGGGDDGFLTYLIFVPANKIGVVVMSNCDCAPIGRIWQQALSVALRTDDKDRKP
jgi:CubicO group peptidase (beta-lactamase class C family)